MQEKPSKIKKVSAHEQVYEQMKNAIVDNQWKVGERLPSEPALAEVFGVNRLTVRIAIQKLNALGIVETKIGDGTYVKEFDFQQYFQEVSQFYMRPSLLEDVCDFRKLVEIECARLAILHATKEELFALEKLCEEYEEQSRKLEVNFHVESIALLAEKDLNLHYKICQMSHNELYAYSFSVARESIYQYLMIILQKRIEGWKQDGDVYKVEDYRHRKIYQSIKDKDFETCRRIYLEMVDHHIDL